MITSDDLIRLAGERISDAEVLLSANKYHGAVYLCGYAVEMALKAKICRTLSWEGYPATAAEFKQYGTFRTHDFDVLLHLSGCETEIKTKAIAEWSIVREWDPEARYNPLETATALSAREMIASSKKLVGEICKK